MISTALKCGERFRRYYIEGERVPAGVAAARGQGLHAASKANLRQKILTHVDLPLNALQDAARDGFIAHVDAGVFLPPEEIPFKQSILNEALKETLKMVEFYGQHIAPGIQPVAVEEPFRTNIEGLPVPLAGTIDIETDGQIEDLKTAGKRWPDGKERSEVQGMLYSYAFQKRTGQRPKFVYRVILSGKRIEGQTLSFVPTNNDYKRMLLTVKRFWQMIEKGVFMPAAPGAWWCSPKWCQYWGTCWYVGNGNGSHWV